MATLVAQSLQSLSRSVQELPVGVNECEVHIHKDVGVFHAGSGMAQRPRSERVKKFKFGCSIGCFWKIYRCRSSQTTFFVLEIPSASAKNRMASMSNLGLFGSCNSFYPFVQLANAKLVRQRSRIHCWML